MNELNKLGRADSGKLQLCQTMFHLLETGEKIKRGCGRRGLMPTEVGWQCFYCGNYIYRTGSNLLQLWFHFRLAREYWRARSRGDQEYINGVPVAGRADSLPSCLLGDLDNLHPPRWFPYFILGAVLDN